MVCAKVLRETQQRLLKRGMKTFRIKELAGNCNEVMCVTVQLEKTRRDYHNIQVSDYLHFSRRLPSAARALVGNKSLSTLAARAERSPSAIQA